MADFPKQDCIGLSGISTDKTFIRISAIALQKGPLEFAAEVPRAVGGSFFAAGMLPAQGFLPITGAEIKTNLAISQKDPQLTGRLRANWRCNRALLSL